MKASSTLRISEAASLGLHTMVVLAGNPQEPLSTGEIASRLQVSEAHLSKVLQRLAAAGLVKSIRGPKGGFLLEKGAARITLLDVYECLDGAFPSGKCLLGTRRCGANQCILGGLLEGVNKEVRDYLGGTRVSHLANAYKGRKEGRGKGKKTGRKARGR